MGRMSELIDAHGRRITYLRVSVTDKCNMRCVYCMPEEGVAPREHREVLRLEEIARIVQVASGLGISRVRLTGGEPLVRKGIVDLVRMLAPIPGLEDLSMTTNAALLERYADSLAVAGLSRVNISLDSLRPGTYARITRRGRIDAALAGIQAAERAGLRPLKLNVVVLRGVNSEETDELAALTLEHAWDVRFIEFMPFWGGQGTLGASLVVPIEEIRARVMALGARAEHREASASGSGGALLGAPLGTSLAHDCGPATYVRLPAAAGRVGFISREGDGFCSRCNRLRLAADGSMRPCLLSDVALDLKAPLRAGADDAAIAGLIREAVRLKPERGKSWASSGPSWQAPPLSEIGG